jgi:hypothetical protein
MALALLRIAAGLLAGSRRCLPTRSLQLHSCTPGLGQADRNGLLGRGRAMLAFSYVVHLLAYEFSRLRAGRFTLKGILASAFDRFFFRHSDLLSFSLLRPRVPKASNNFCSSAGPFPV